MTYYHDSHINAADFDNNDDVSIVKVSLDERDYEKYGLNEECNPEGFLIEITTPARTNYDSCMRTTQHYFTEEEFVEIIELGVKELRARKQEAQEWESQHEQENDMTPEEERQVLYEHYNPDFREREEAIRQANEYYDEYMERNR